MCAELEAFIDSRGPVIVGALDFAARGELGDEGKCGSQMDWQGNTTIAIQRIAQ